MKLSSLRVYISNARKALKNVNKMALSVPSESYRPKVSMRGRNLIVDGKAYTPKQLEALAGKEAEFQIPAIEALETYIEDLEYTRVAMTGKSDKLTMLDEYTAELAKSGLALVTPQDELQFVKWLNYNGRGSKGSRKNLYYRVFGALDITRGYITGFLEYMGVTSMEELEDLDV